MRSAATARALALDPEGRLLDDRTEFQRDRDRILHSRAFRRLRLKSSGGADPPSERYRDRLTHTLEVTQWSRTVARGLGLNEDLVEAIALGHELGAPPFGEAGADVLDALLPPRGGGFLVASQSLRVVERIEKRYDHPGLNLTDAVREGILKHAGAPLDALLRAAYGKGLDAAHRREVRAALRPELPPFLEAQVVAAVESLASVVQDLDDGLRAGDLDPAEVAALPIVRELDRRMAATGGARPGARGRSGGSLYMRANRINRGLTHLMVTGLIHHSRRALAAWSREEGIASPADFLKARPRLPAGLIGLTPAAARLYHGLRRYITRDLHQSAWFTGVAARARIVITGLFRALTEDPRLADDYLLLRFREEQGGPYLRDVSPSEIGREVARRYRGSDAFARLTADHIAGMTDLYAVSEYERLCGPFMAKGGAR